MRVMVALENRFLKTRNGNIYSTTVYDYDFWKRYLQVFDEVLIFARLAETTQEQLDRSPTLGPHVHFIALPSFTGPWQYLKNYYALNLIAKQALEEADAFILRVPGILGTLLWHSLRKRGIPYAVEVVGDPWDSLSPGSVKSILRPWIRQKAARDLGQQCRLAAVASYVTEYSLQKRYPPGGWSIHFSDVRLPDGAIIEQPEFEKRIERIRSKTK